MSAGWEWGRVSHVGGREENQDSFCVLADGASGDVLAAVADGMGGHDEGGLAARLAIDVVRELWPQRKRKSPGEFLSDLFGEAHEAIREEAAKRGLDTRTVLAVLYISGGTAYVAHAGDCRIIQYRDGARARRTLDHSLAQLSVLRGKITEAQMATSKGQSRLTTCLGGEEPPDTEVEGWDLETHDRFVVCSDGFWEIFDDVAQQALLEQPNLTEALERVVAERLSSPEMAEHDNTTAILIRQPVGVVVAGDAPGIARRSSRRSLLLAALLLPLLAGLVYWVAHPLFSVESSHSQEGPEVTRDDESGDSVVGAAQVPPSDPGAKSGKKPGMGDSDMPILTDAKRPKKPPADEVEPASRVRLTLDLPAESVDAAVESAEEALRREGRLDSGTELAQVPGTDADVVEPLEGNDGPTRNVRVGQKLGELRIYGAEVLLRIKGDKLVALDGTTYGEISPAEGDLLPFEEALRLASSGKTPKLLGGASKWLYLIEETALFRIVWIVDVLEGGDGRYERWFIDALSGELVRTLPLVAGTKEI